jgi:CHAT domain
MAEFRIAIRSVGGQDFFDVFGLGLPQAGTSVTRPAFSINSALADSLRRGNALAPEVRQVIQAVSQWVGHPAVTVPLTFALAQPGDPVRLIFSVDDAQLRNDLSDVPFELIQIDNQSPPLAVHPKLGSFVHLMPKAGQEPAASAIDVGTLRILIVRSNPMDLRPDPNDPNRGVPRAMLFVNQIRQIHSGPLVQVDVLTRDEGADTAIKGLPTRDSLYERVSTDAYHIFVYLGHGDVASGHTDVAPIGLLQLETADGRVNDPVPANKLAELLLRWPIPVVLLIGCQTATAGAPAAPNQPLIDQRIPQWLRGSQGVAQALVNSVAGVSVAVGMRYRIEADHAVTFLTTFLHNLLIGNNQGHVERAVTTARARLSFAYNNEYSWSAPMVFAAPHQEPLFRFSTPRMCPVFPDDRRRIRTQIWEYFSHLPLSQRVPSLVKPLRDILTQIETTWLSSAGAAVPLLVPSYAEGTPGQEVELTVELTQPLHVDRLAGLLKIGANGAVTNHFVADQALGANHFTVAGTTAANVVFFCVTRNNSGAFPLPAGTLFRIRVRLGPTPMVIHPVTIESLIANPVDTLTCVWDNALVVAPA